MTDEPREIAPCPMPGCGGPVRIIPQRVHGLLYGYQAGCVDCDYRFGRSLPTRSDAIAAHNALCADVQRGREAVRIEQERGALRAEVERLSAALTALHLESDHDAEYLRGEVERLRAVEAAASEASENAVEAAASEASENALDMGPYYQARVEEIDALRAALDAGEGNHANG